MVRVWQTLLGLACCFLLTTAAHGGQFELRPTPSIKPGDWVRLQFDVRGIQTAQPSHRDEVSLQLPKGWSVLIPPALTNDVVAGVSRLTAAISVAEDALAGQHALTLTHADTSQIFYVEVEPIIDLRWALVDFDQRHRAWWVASPLDLEATLSMAGNVDLDVVFSVEAPASLDIELIHNRARVTPQKPAIIRLTVKAKTPEALLPKERIPIRLNVDDPITQERLTSHQIWLEVLTPGSGRSSHARAPVRGYAEMRYLASNQTSPLDNAQLNVEWGLTGVFDTSDQSKARWQTAFHSQAERGRYLNWTGEHAQIRFGTQLYGSDGLSVRPRLAQGIAVSWFDYERSGGLGGELAVGWQHFIHGRDRYHQPWARYGAYTFGWVTQTRTENSSSQTSHWPFMSWQWDSTSSSERHHQLSSHWSYHDDRLSGIADYRYLPNRDTTWQFEFASIDSDHPSQYPSGRYAHISRSQRIDHGYWQVRAQVRSPMEKAAWLSSGSAYWWHQRQGQSKHAYGLGLVWNRSASRRYLQARWRIKHPGIYWSGVLRSDGHFGWHGVFSQAPVGTWYLDHQPQQSQASLLLDKIDNHALMVGLQRRRDSGTQDDRLFLNWEFQSSHHSRWQLTLTNSLTKDDGLQGWLRYQWDGFVSNGFSTKAHGGYLRGHVVKRTVLGDESVAGALVHLGERVAKTDTQGRYQFSHLPPGEHQLHLSVPPADARWMPTKGHQRTAVLGADQRHSIDWVLVESAKLEGTIIGIEHLITDDTRPSVRLIGTCAQCPIATRHRISEVDDQGRFRVDQLMPGVWRWTVSTSAMPRDYVWKEKSQEVTVVSGQTQSLTWVIEESRPPIQWLIIDSG